VRAERVFVRTTEARTTRLFNRAPAASPSDRADDCCDDAGSGGETTITRMHRSSRAPVCRPLQTGFPVEHFDTSTIYTRRPVLVDDNDALDDANDVADIGAVRSSEHGKT